VLNFHFHNLKSFLDGLKLIINTSLLKNANKGEAVDILLPNGRTPALVYQPRKKEKGLIITFTGFTMSGYQDARMVVLNNAFAKLGFRVITPKISTIDALLIHPSAVDEIKVVIQSISSDPTLNPKQFHPAVFAPSFTAGIAALAVAELPAKSVSSLCLLGTYADFKTTIHYALGNEKSMDDYGMHILMKNFLKYELGDHPKLEALVQTALEDNGLKRQVPVLPELLAKSDKETLELYQKLRFNTEFRKELIMRAWTKIPDFEIWKDRLDPAKHAHKITCPVTIIHGIDDNVIPSSQSLLLHTLLQENKGIAHLELSNLLDHGDPKLSFKIFGEVLNLAKAFGYFIKNSQAQSF